MSDSKKKPDMDEEEFKAFDATIVPERSMNQRTIRSVCPLGMRVLVKIRDVESVTEGGLYIPEGAKKSMSESVLAEVLEVASAKDDSTDETTNISGIPQGATVLIGKSVGTSVPWDDALRIVDTKDILALVEEIQLT